MRWAAGVVRNLTKALAAGFLVPLFVMATGFSIRIVCFGRTKSVCTPFLFAKIASFS